MKSIRFNRENLIVRINRILDTLHSKRDKKIYKYELYRQFRITASEISITRFHTFSLQSKRVEWHNECINYIT